MVKVIIDAGHGVNTPGKRLPAALDSNQTREWTLNNRIANKIEDLAEQYKGIEIVRVDDTTGRTDIPLSQRSAKANAEKGDILLSIHHNAGANLTNAGGIQVYVFNGSLLPATRRLQKANYDSLIKHTGLKGNRATPLPSANFHMVREPRMPCLLIEHGFMDSRIDAPIILTERFANQAAQAHMEFLAKEFKLEKIPQPVPNGKLWRVQVGAYSNYDNAKRMEDRLKKAGFPTWITRG